MESAYLIKISKEDYEGISDCSGGFYAEYLLAVLEEQSPVIDRQLKTTGKSIRLLTEWYNNIINDRKEFE